MIAFKANLEDLIANALATPTPEPPTPTVSLPLSETQGKRTTTVTSDQRRFRNLLEQLRTTKAPVTIDQGPNHTTKEDSTVEGCTNFGCVLGKNIQGIKSELENIVATYVKIKTKFLNTVQHLQNHPNNLNRDSIRRNKRSAIDDDYVYLTREEYQVYNAVATALEIVLPPGNHTRVKRFGLDTIVLGAGIYANRHDIEKLRKNLHILQDQNVLQDKQIKTLASHLDKTILQVNKHSGILKDLNKRILLAEKSLEVLFGEVNKLQYGLYLSNALRHKLSKCHVTLTQLEMACDEIYEILRALVSQQVTPVLFPPAVMNDTLYEVKDQLSRYSNLCLPKEPEQSLWDIYPLLRVTPVIVDNIVVLMLKIPLVDKKVNVTLYRVHNLPALHPRLGIGYHFVLEGEYYMITQDGKYEAVPRMENALACVQSKGHVCTLQTALYRTQTSRLCLSALYQHNTSAIDLYCTVDPHLRSDSLATNLGHHVWAVSAVTKDTLHITCPLVPNRIQTIHPPLTFLEIGEGCEAFSNSLYIPSTYQFNTATNNLRARMFIEFNDVYQQPELYSQWFPPIKPQLTTQEIEQHKLQIRDLEPLPMHQFNRKLTQLDENYVSWMPSTDIICLGLAVFLFVSLLLIIGYIYWKCRKTAVARSTITKLITGKPRPKQTPAQARRPPTPLARSPRPDMLEMTVKPVPQPRLKAARSAPNVEYSSIEDLRSAWSLVEGDGTTRDLEKAQPAVSETLNDALTSLAQENTIDINKYRKYLEKRHARVAMLDEYDD